MSGTVEGKAEELADLADLESRAGLAENRPGGDTDRGQTKGPRAAGPAGRVFLGLTHYPIYNKRREIVATSITNLDIHDISRLAATYDLKKYFLIHPHPSQRKLVGELLEFWRQGYGGEYNPDRREALERVALIESIAAAEDWIRGNFGGPVVKVVTDAHINPETVSYAELRRLIWQGPGPAAAERGETGPEAKIAALASGAPVNYLLLFGTGHGLAPEVMESADLVLAPILGLGQYNHLSVRSAAAIILDRLLGS